MPCHCPEAHFQTVRAERVLSKNLTRSEFLFMCQLWSNGSDCHTAVNEMSIQTRLGGNECSHHLAVSSMGMRHGDSCIRCSPLPSRLSSVQSPSCVQLFATPRIAARQASLFITISRSSLRLTSIESVMTSSHLILCCPLLSRPQSLPASESFPMSQLFSRGGQSTGVSALASFLPKKSQG